MKAFVSARLCTLAALFRSTGAASSTLGLIAAPAASCSIEHAGSCGTMCKAYGASDVGSCGKDRWTMVDFDGTCGSSPDRACHISVNSAFDASQVTCGKCYQLSVKSGSQTHKTYLKVIDVAKMASGAVVRLPAAVFKAACPFHCATGGCAAKNGDCSTVEFDDCAYGNKDTKEFHFENFDYQLVDCKSGKPNAAISSMLPISLVAIASLLTIVY